MKHLLKLEDLTKKELLSILGLADQLKFELKNNIKHERLKGKTLGMIFAKSSTRTRVSFEVGMYQLGGHALFLSSNDLQIGRGEPVEDTARVLSRYLDGIMIRTFKQEDVENLAKFGTIPIINGLTDYCHPCQVLADLMTIREFKGGFENLKLTFIGDGNNMANSLIAGCLTLGIKIAIACPNGYEPDAKLIARGVKTGLLTLTNDVLAAATDADVLYTDVWASMGQEKEKAAREKAFCGYQVNAEVMAAAHSDAMVLHCLPAHRGEEISADVLEAHADEIFEEAENRLHAQKAVLVTLMENPTNGAIK
ncbi:MAG: ornithine carbamoyltransferase [Clostridia bacterium]